MKTDTTLLTCAIVAIITICCTIYLNNPINVIQKIYSYNEVVPFLQSLDQNSLVLFDFKNTLVVYTTPALRRKTKTLLHTFFSKIIPTPSKSADYYLSIITMTEPPLIIEPCIIPLITDLQNRGIKVLALTSVGTGECGLIPSLHKWRSTVLQRLGIDFSKADVPDTIFSQLPNKSGTKPALYQGVIATNHESKGVVLGVLLDYYNWQPSAVILFDNSKKRVLEVAHEMRKRSIPFYGFQYIGARFVSGTSDPHITQKQLQHLIKHEQWLSEEEIQNLYPV